MWYLVPVVIACLAYIVWYVLSYWSARMYPPQPPAKIVYVDWQSIRPDIDYADAA